MSNEFRVCFYLSVSVSATVVRGLPLYKENTGTDMKDAAQSWEDWVRGINANSNVYVDWQ